MGTSSVVKWFHWGYIGFSIGSTLFMLRVLRTPFAQSLAPGECPLAATLKRSALARAILINTAHVVQQLFTTLLCMLFLGLPRTEQEATFYHSVNIRFLAFQLSFCCCILRQTGTAELPMWAFWNGITGSILMLVAFVKERLRTLVALRCSARPKNNVRLLALIALNALMAAANLLGILVLLPGPALAGMKLVVALQAAIAVVRTIKQVVVARLHVREVQGVICWEQRSLGSLRASIFEQLLCTTLSVLQSSLLLLQQQSVSAMGVLLTLKAALTLHKLLRLMHSYRQLSTCAMLVDAALRVVEPAAVPSERRSCPICREDMERAVRLDCGHYFHKSCLVCALDVVPVCPVCRSAIVYRTADDGADEPGFESRYYGNRTLVEWLLRRLRVPLYVATPRMVDQVLRVLPTAPRLAVIRELAATGSVDATVVRLRRQLALQNSSAINDQLLQQQQQHNPTRQPLNYHQQPPRTSAGREAGAPGYSFEGMLYNRGNTQSLLNSTSSNNSTGANPPSEFVQRKLQLFRQACERFHSSSSSNGNE